jgi:hypothetical protein
MRGGGSRTMTIAKRGGRGGRGRGGGGSELEQPGTATAGAGAGAGSGSGSGSSASPAARGPGAFLSLVLLGQSACDLELSVRAQVLALSHCIPTTRLGRCISPCVSRMCGVRCVQ